jgi:hypothetical protein
MSDVLRYSCAVISIPDGLAVSSIVVTVGDELKRVDGLKPHELKRTDVTGITRE